MAQAMTQELAKDSVRWQVLVELAAGARHGYDVWRELNAQGHPHVRNPSSVYRALRGLKDSGLVTAHWEFSDSGPARRVYALTSDGRKALQR